MVASIGGSRMCQIAVRVFGIALLVGKFASTSRMAAEEPVPELSAVPQQKELQSAAENVRKLFEAEFNSAKRHTEKRALAAKLLQLAQETSKPVERFALFDEARKLAAQAQEPQLAMDIVTSMAEYYTINRAQAYVATMEASANAVSTPGSRRKFVDCTVFAADEAVQSRQLPLARKALELRLAEARKANYSIAVKAISADLELVKAGVELQQGVDAATQRLAEDANDPDAHFVVGKYLCFALRDWREGCAHLARGSQQDLKQVAESELAIPEDASNQLSLGDGWWKVADAENGPWKPVLLERAGFWYRQAVPSLEGIDKARVEKRLAQLAPPRPTSPGPVAPKAMLLSDLKPIELNSQEKWEVGGYELKEKPYPGSFVLHPASNQSAMAVFELPAGYRSFYGSVGIADSILASSGRNQSGSPLVFRIVGDKTELWRSRPLQERGAQEFFNVPISRVGKLKLYVDCPGWNGAAHAVWASPTLSAAVVKRTASSSRN